MKIIQLNFERTWRGGERQTIETALALKQYFGHEVVVLCRKGFPLSKAAKKAGLVTIEYAAKWEVLRFLVHRGRHFDIYHAETAQMLTLCAVAKTFLKGKIVYSRRLDFVPHGFFTLLKYRMADKIVAISGPIADILARKSIRNIVTIPDMVVPRQLSVERALKLLQANRIPTGCPYIIGTLAAFEPHKDPMTMIRAVQILRKKRSDFIFIHCGNGSLYESCRVLIREAGLEGCYFAPGFVEEPDDLFSILDVFVFSSKEEGLGSSILDAFQYGVPVAATLAGGIKDLIPQVTGAPERSRGIGVPVGEAAALAAAVNTLLDDQDKRNICTANAYEYVIRHNGAFKVAEDYHDLFTRLLSQ